MTNEEKLKEFLPIITRVARRIARDYHMIDAEDIEQELICFVLKRMQSDTPLAQPSEVKWSMQSFLNRVGRTYAFQQKQQHYLIDSQISYEVKDIRDILETQFDPTMWDYVSDDSSVEDMVAAHSDVAWALDRLALKDKQFVADCYKAARLPMSGTKEYRKLRDLIIKIANMCNHYTRADEGEGPGRRKAMTNSSARAAIDSEG